MDIFIIFTFMYTTIAQRICCPKFEMPLRSCNEEKAHMNKLKPKGYFITISKD